MRYIENILEEMDSIRYKQGSIKKDAENLKRVTQRLRMNFDYKTENGGRSSFYYCVEDSKLEADIKDAILKHLRTVYTKNNTQLKNLIEELKTADTDEI